MYPSRGGTTTQPPSIPKNTSPAKSVMEKDLRLGDSHRRIARGRLCARSSDLASRERI